MRHVIILNGPNLNMLGTREPKLYGHQTLADIQERCETRAEALGLTIDFRQSNHEGTLVDWVQEAGQDADGLIINPAGFGHTSVALLDAVKSISIPIIEVHLSNIFTREEFRHHTFTSQAVRGVISGLGAHGYVLAIEALSAL